MSITIEDERIGMQETSDAVAIALNKMRQLPGQVFQQRSLTSTAANCWQMGARSAPAFTYGFPGYTCISINEEAAHGIPSVAKILKEGDLVKHTIMVTGGQPVIFAAQNGVCDSLPVAHTAVAVAPPTLDG